MNLTKQDLEILTNLEGPEIWRKVPSLIDDLYEVSNFGRVRSFKKGRHGIRRSPEILRPNNSGYYQVYCFSFRGSLKIKKIRTHVLVATAFLGPRPNGKEVAHINGKKNDNRASNLFWVTKKENESHKRIHGTLHVGSKHINAKFDDRHIVLIKHLFSGFIPSHTSLAKELNVSRTTIDNILKGKRYNYAKQARKI